MKNPSVIYLSVSSNFQPNEITNFVFAQEILPWVVNILSCDSVTAMEWFFSD
jgi:hypothetical protein